MNETNELIFPPREWMSTILQIARSGGWGVAHLSRNFFGATRQWIVRDLRIAQPNLRGTQFGSLDDLLLLNLAPQIDPSQINALLDRFQPKPMQVVASLILGQGSAMGQWCGLLWAEMKPVALEAFRFVGPRMRRFHARPIPPLKPESDVARRWSRTRGALGNTVWQRIRQSCVAIVGAGRNGSVAAQTLTMLGVGKLILIDGDREELHNLDATVLTFPSMVGKPKVDTRRESILKLRPNDMEVLAIAQSILHPDAPEALREADLIVTCVDRDAARLAVATLANAWCKVHLDIGSGVFEQDSQRRMGGDVRLLLPGEACVNCLGGLRNPDQAQYEANTPPNALRRGPFLEWHEQRAGSLLTLNQIVVNTGFQSWLDLLSGTIRSSRWLHLEWDVQHGVATEIHTTPEPYCEICHGTQSGNHPQSPA